MFTKLECAQKQHGTSTRTGMDVHVYCLRPKSLSAQISLEPHLGALESTTGALEPFGCRKMGRWNLTLACWNLTLGRWNPPLGRWNRLAAE